MWRTIMYSNTKECENGGQLFTKTLDFCLGDVQHTLSYGDYDIYGETLIDVKVIILCSFLFNG